MKKVILIDGHNLLFRMFYGIPSPIKNSKGKDIRGLIGFIGSLKKLNDEFSPHSLIVIFDSETSKKDNLQIDTEYKANRMDYTDIVEEENPFSQLPLIKKALDFLKIMYTEVENYEADDYIASIVSNTKGDYKYIIVSTDTDFIQLVDDKVGLYIPRGKNSILYDEAEVIKKYGIPPKRYALFKSLVGDKSDNIKGVQGIGKVSASKILKYNSIREFTQDNPNSRFTKILKDNMTIIEKNKNLINLNKNLDTSKIKFEVLREDIIGYKTYEIIEKIGER